MRVIKMDTSKALRRTAEIVGGLAAGLMGAGMAMAQNLADAANSVSDGGEAFGGLAWMAFSLIGFVVAGIGVLKIINAKKTNEGIGMGVGMAVGGAVLASLPFLINATTQQTFNENASGLEVIGVE